MNCLLRKETPISALPDDHLRMLQHNIRYKTEVTLLFSFVITAMTEYIIDYNTETIYFYLKIILKLREKQISGCAKQEMLLWVEQKSHGINDTLFFW